MHNKQLCVPYFLCLVVLISCLTCTLISETSSPEPVKLTPGSSIVHDFSPTSEKRSTTNFLSSPRNYTDHAPIFINGNADLLTQAVNEGWNGTGTVENPFIISGYSITSTNSSIAPIEIRDTTMAFWINNCFLADATAAAGIVLENVTAPNLREVRIFDNTIKNTFLGVSLNSTSGISLFDNTLGNSRTSNQIGVYLTGAADTVVTRNTIYGNGLGIKIDSAVNNTQVRENDFIAGFQITSKGNRKSLNSSQAYDNGTNTTFISNYWSDWIQPDADDDGIVDVPYLVNGSAGNQDPHPRTYRQLKRGPIFIKGNDDLLAQAAVEGWPGDGEWDNHITITGYNITATNASVPLIEVHNVTLLFDITNNFLMGAKEAAGVDLERCWYNLYSGIFTNHIFNNTILNNKDGMILNYCNNFDIIDNLIANNRRGLYIYSKYNDIFPSYPDLPSAFTFLNNTIANNTEGIVLERTAAVFLAFTTLINNQIGINLGQVVKHLYVLQNTFSNNEWGIKIPPSAVNTQVWENDFMGNGPSLVASQVYDEGRNTNFTHNYWADWTQPDANGDGVVDVPYPIDGSAGNHDLYPLNEPHLAINRESSTPPRLLANSFAGMSSNLLVVLSLSLVLLIIILGLTLLLTNPKIQGTIPFVSRPSVSPSTEPSLWILIGYYVLLGAGWYLLSAWGSLALIFLTSAPLFTGNFFIDLVNGFLFALAYPVVHPVTILPLLAAIFIPTMIVGSWSGPLGVMLIGVHLLAGLSIGIIYLKLIRPRLAELFPEKLTARQWIERLTPSDGAMEVYWREADKEVQKTMENDQDHRVMGRSKNMLEKLIEKLKRWKTTRTSKLLEK